MDWWALGILTYEMVVGFPPFYTGSSDNKRMYEYILKKPVYYPDAKKHGITMSNECKDFINRCLSKDPKHRLGTSGGVEEIISHPWFKSISFEKLLAKDMKPEFRPKLSKDILDVSNFDEMFTQDEAIHSVLPWSAQKKIKMENYKFKGFDEL